MNNFTFPLVFVTVKIHLPNFAVIHFLDGLSKLALFHFDLFHPIYLNFDNFKTFEIFCSTSFI